jgi:hypothetical protein
VEGIDLLRRLRREREMDRAGRHLMRVGPEGRLVGADPDEGHRLLGAAHEQERMGAVVEGLQAERARDRVVEAARGAQVAHPEADVVEHGDPFLAVCGWSTPDRRPGTAAPRIVRPDIAYARCLERRLARPAGIRAA